MNTLFFQPILSLAQEGLELTQTTTTTTQQLSPEEAQKVLTGFLALGIPMFLIAGVISLGSFIIWIVALVHAISNDIQNKALWIIGMIVIGPLISLIYLLTEKKSYEASHTLRVDSLKKPTEASKDEPQTPVGVTIVEPIPPKVLTETQVQKTIEFKPVEEVPEVKN